jgi:hypothetical protein
MIRLILLFVAAFFGGYMIGTYLDKRRQNKKDKPLNS